jgi:hypothetical protein
LARGKHAICCHASGNCTKAPGFVENCAAATGAHTKDPAAQALQS